MCPTTLAAEPATANLANSSTANNTPEENKLTLLQELSSHLNLLQVAHAHNDRRLVSRVLQHLPQIRRQLSVAHLSKLLESPSINVQLTPAIQTALNAVKPSEPLEEEISNLVEGDDLIERNSYVMLLISVFLLDSKQVNAAMEASSMAVMLIQGSADHFNTFDPLLGRHYYFLARACELANSLPALHNFLMVGLRTAALRHDKETEATVYNCVLRLHLLENNYEAAGIFLKNSAFPSGTSSLNNQTARYHFYRAQIVSALSTNYAEASEDLNQALRKVPHGRFALNFILSATKFLIAVQLLRGVIPDLSTFSLHSRALKPYLELTQSVRLGDLNQFQAVVSRHMDIWNRDGTKILVERLHQSVLRVGLRRLCQSYVRIGFADVAKKLGLPSEKEASVLIQKALNEGVISAHINESLSCLESQKVSDLYTTREPQESFNSRTRVLQQFHTEAVKAMRFPEKSSRKDSKGDEERRPTDEELMDEFMDADEEMF